MQLRQLQLKNFRCFSDTTLDMDGPLVLIEGVNGAGKTTLLEALHYLCYLRSFRTHSTRELVKFGQDSFFVRATFETTSFDTSVNNEIQVGYSGAKRLVRINKKAVSSYKELMDYYRVITLTEDDIELIKGGPEIRRAFIDQALVLHEPSFMSALKTVRHVLENRNKLLKSRSYTNDSLAVWTEQLWSASQVVQHKRIAYLAQIERDTNVLLKEYFEPDLDVLFTYKPRRIDLGQTFEQFIAGNDKMFADEARFGRSLFGAHLDDFSITFTGQSSRNYSSRGQQKLVVLLIKIAQIKELSLKKGPSIFLLDDFMSDFDEDRIERLITTLLSLKTQLIFTTPTTQGRLNDILHAQGAYKVNITK